MNQCQRGLMLQITLVIFVLMELSMAKASQSTAGRVGARESGKTVAAGVWGGQGVRLEVTAQGGSLEFDCANAQLVEPLMVDGNGKFRARGIFESEHGGPVRKDETPTGQDTVFTGIISSDTMKIEFVVTRSAQPEGPFTLARGNPGRLRKCR